MPLNLFDPFKMSANASPEKKASGMIKEVNNGRLAMIGIMGFLAKARLPGSVPMLGFLPHFSGDLMAPFIANLRLDGFASSSGPPLSPLPRAPLASHTLRLSWPDSPFRLDVKQLAAPLPTRDPHLDTGYAIAIAVETRISLVPDGSLVPRPSSMPQALCGNGKRTFQSPD